MWNEEDSCNEEDYLAFYKFDCSFTIANHFLIILPLLINYIISLNSSFIVKNNNINNIILTYIGLALDWDEI